MNEEQMEVGIEMLAQDGYTQGGYNPHNVRAWVISNQFGILYMVIGECEQTALDAAVDANAMDSEMMSDEDYAEYEREGWDDSYILLGNASEPFWCEYLYIECVATTNE